MDVVTAGGPHGRWPRLLGWAWRGFLVLLALAFGAGWLALRGSLPPLDGQVAVAGLGDPVTVERDELGVPTVRGSTRLDLARATGFLHGQERFFQMDLLRRRAAGELAELVGPAALPLDRRTRRLRLRAVAGRAVEAADAGQRALLAAYAEGVDAGVGQLEVRPFEYLVLGARPAPWRPEDSMLVVLAMFIELNGETGARDAVLGAVRDTLPAPFLELLAPLGGEWDAPLEGGPLATPPLPGPEVLDLRTRPASLGLAPPAPEEPDAPPGRLARAWLGDRTEAAGEDEAPGSNAWAVDGRRSTDGGALVADDMHLGHAVPNIWFRASLAWSEDGQARRLTGVTLPGVPALVAGSNGHVAWGFTNSYGDWQDLVELESPAGAPDEYLTPEGPRRLERITEVIRVKGGADERLEVLGTIWGPVVDVDLRGRRRALAWTALRPGGLDLGLAALERAGDLDAALDAANGAGIPPQNFVAADAAGRIGWTIAGHLPRRVGFDGRLPGSWADGTRRWDGWRAPGETPRIVDPPSGRLWTANTRVVEGADLARIGDGGYALGARARQIRDDLLARPRFAERDLMAIQLDDRALFLSRWQALLVAALDPAAVAADPRRAEVRRLAEDWGGRASIDSVGYRLVRGWRLAVTARALAPFLAEVRRAAPKLQPGDLLQAEGFVWRLVTERPAHLLAPAEGSWERLLLGALDDTLAALPQQGFNLEARTWGEANTTLIRHPLSASLPGSRRLLDMRRDPVPGDANMPRVARPDFGASERFVVSPGREAEGIFNMPGGQSGHPLSPYYRAGHAAWVEGEPTPFLPGPARHTLQLLPSGR